MTPATALPDEAASLFRESPEAFIAARDALASRLREDGRGDDAATVKALRKPTVVAWALNQLSDRDPDGVRALVAAGAEVRAAQQAALSSKRGAAERLRSAGAARREAVGTLSSSAPRWPGSAVIATRPRAALGELVKPRTGSRTSSTACADALRSSNASTRTPRRRHPRASSSSPASSGA